MAQNVTIAGASYSNVPSITVPKTGGGTASFTDVTGTTAIAGDVASGKYFFSASGVLTLGTASGGTTSLRELICPQQTVTPSSYTVSLDHDAGLFIGGHYVVTYDGTEYVFSAGNLWGGNQIVVGEQTYYYDHSTRTDEIAPFALYESFNDISRTPKLYAKDNNSHTIKVERIDRDDITTTTICPQQTVTTNSSKIGSLSNTTAQLVLGDYYLVTYDGTEWMVTAAYLWGETTGVGDDQTIWSSTTDDTVYPFFAYNNGQGMGFYAIDANASHTIKIEHIDSIPDALVLTTKTITSNGTYNASSDNATGYSSVTVNVSGGGGGTQAGTVTQDSNGFLVLDDDAPVPSGLEYETGTWTPSEDVASYSISFANTHTVAPWCYVVADATKEYSSTLNTNYLISYINYGQVIDSSLYVNNAGTVRYGVTDYAFRGSNATSFSTGSGPVTYPYTNQGSSGTTYSRYWATESGIKAYAGSASAYWRSGRTYKWIAVWAPTS